MCSMSCGGAAGFSWAKETHAASKIAPQIAKVLFMGLLRVWSPAYNWKLLSSYSRERSSGIAQQFAVRQVGMRNSKIEIRKWKCKREGAKTRMKEMKTRQPRQRGNCRHSSSHRG